MSYSALHETSNFRPGTVGKGARGFGSQAALQRLLRDAPVPDPACERPWEVSPEDSPEPRVRLAAQLLIYPVTDFDFTTESYEQNGEGYLLTKGSMQWFWAHYLGAQDLGKDPYACPARADDLSGLPPAFVATAEFDPLRDEGEAYAANLRIAGVEVSAKRYDGMLHGFAWTLGATPSGAALIEDLAAAFGRVLEGAR
jgi:acetyl esterase/lipase